MLAVCVSAVRRLVNAVFRRGRRRNAISRQLTPRERDDFSIEMQGHGLVEEDEDSRDTCLPDRPV